MRRYCIGHSDFATLVKRQPDGQFANYFVDKSLFIREFLDQKKPVIMLTRPRRFGKSTNIDMLRCFFNIDDAKINRELFVGLKIENAKLKNQEPCLAYQGGYPVIHLNFKDLKQDNFSSFLSVFKVIISDLCKEFSYLEKSNKLILEEKQQIQKFIARTASNDDYMQVLKLLIAYLQAHHNQKVIVLIDEYDVPLQNAIHLRDYSETEAEKKLGKKFLRDVESFLGVFLGALKDNVKLEKALMTGVVRLAGGGIFSNLNNMDVFTILDEPFSESFGFTEIELTHLLQQIAEEEPKKTEQLGGIEKFRQWYNGYQFGVNVIYNPWSAMKALDREQFGPYWIETSNNSLIHSMLLNPKTAEDTQEINRTIAGLISNQKVQKLIDVGLIFDSRVQDLDHLWVLLLSAGYLSGTQQPFDKPGKVKIELKIPNNEVRPMYEQVFIDWLKDCHHITQASPLVEHLLKGEVEPFCNQLQRIFENVVSVRDMSRAKEIAIDEAARYEAFYHGFMVALLGLSLDSGQHSVLLQSNRESGSGFYDLVLEPKNLNDPVYHKGVIFEFKRCLHVNQLRSEASKALQQIEDQAYTTAMKNKGVKSIVCIGVAFCQKKLASCHKTITS